jgi:hypothetical protein
MGIKRGLSPDMTMSVVCFEVPHQGAVRSSETLGSLETLDECLVADTCIDQYLWSAYQRTLKRDTIKVPEKKKVIVKKNGKTRTVVKTITKLVDEDFTWKDPKAAERAACR